MPNYVRLLTCAMIDLIWFDTESEKDFQCGFVGICATHLLLLHQVEFYEHLYLALAEGFYTWYVLDMSGI